MAPKTEEQLRQKAARYLASKIDEVSCFSASLEAKIPKFENKELEFGTFLGAGGFCIVSELSGINTGEKEAARDKIELDDEGKVIQDKDFIASHLYRDNCARYAIKKLAPTLFRKPAGTFLSGVVDLAMEVKYLAVIQHPHIIKMRAVSSSHPCSDTYFIILDRLYETLTDRIATWKKSSKKLRGFGTAVRRLSVGGAGKLKNEKEAFLAERLLVAHDISSALSFLHGNKIVYRDIKPDNIGFDIRGDVKIFDFGLAKELSECYRVEGTDLFKLTKRCGSPRYMAPEVFKGQPYNQFVDVHGFSLMLWQIIECTTPFDNYSYDRLHEEVMERNLRPPINDKTPSTVNNLISKSWHHDMSKRPECAEICSTLKDFIVLQCGEQMLEEMDFTNRTEASIKLKKETN